jgi:hypothetical protein
MFLGQTTNIVYVMWQTDQRRSKRFELQLPLEVVKAGANDLSAASQTRNLSSSGVLFVSNSKLPVGESIEYRIALPHGTQVKSLSLHCIGKVLRHESLEAESTENQMFKVAATLDRYEFVRGAVSRA